MTRYEHDHVFNNSIVSKFIGPPPQEFLDTHWKLMIENDVCEVDIFTFKKVIEMEWEKNRDEIMRDFGISDN